MALSPKKFTVCVVAALAGPVLLVLGYNIYIDPFQIFHKDLKQPTVVLGGRGKDRYQQAGIINQYDVGSVIIGHSHSANYLPSMLSIELGWENVYSLTMDGAQLYEQALVAKRVFSKHTIENVLWGVAVPNLAKAWATKNQKLPMEEYLYDGNRLNDLRFFLTFDLYKYYQQKQKRRNIILEADNSLQLAQEEFDKATSWYDRRVCGFNRPVFVADKILRGKALRYNEKTREKLTPISTQMLIDSPLDESNERLRNYKNNLDRHLLPIIKQNPSTVFHFVLTAYPTLEMQKMKESRPVQYEEYLKLLREFVVDMHKFQNVQVFAFDNEEFTNDLRLYKDLSHYHLAVNQQIVEKISSKHNMLTPENVEEYILAFDEKVSRFRLSDRWNPHVVKDFSKSGYLSMEAAKMLIDGVQPYTDEEITKIATQDTSLPKCATGTKKRQNSKL